MDADDDEGCDKRTFFVRMRQYFFFLNIYKKNVKVSVRTLDSIFVQKKRINYS